MDYSKLVAVTGLPGLYELISSKNDGAIVRSLEDNSTKFAASRVHNFSHLESIEVYTVRDNVNLVEIFQAMDKAGGTLPDGKDTAKLKQCFEGAYPDLDFERVYASDLKKMVKWFDILKKKNVELKLSELPEEEEEVEEEVAPKEKSTAAKEAPSTKAAAKKKDDADEVAEKPAKKAAAKKEEKEEKEVAAKKKTPAKKEDKEEKAAAPKKKTAEAPAKKAAPKKK